MIAKDIFAEDRPTNDGSWTISFDNESGHFPLWTTRGAAERVAKKFADRFPQYSYSVIPA